jgi:hypothetical protein
VQTGEAASVTAVGLDPVRGCFGINDGATTSQDTLIERSSRYRS